MVEYECSINDTAACYIADQAANNWCLTTEEAVKVWGLCLRQELEPMRSLMINLSSSTTCSAHLSAVSLVYPL
jgi:hypothetical protein